MLDTSHRQIWRFQASVGREDSLGLEWTKTFGFWLLTKGFNRCCCWSSIEKSKPVANASARQPVRAEVEFS